MDGNVLPDNMVSKLTAAKVTPMDVLLVSMPFGSLIPSIGLSLLKSAVASLACSTAIRYFTLDFAEIIGTELYNDIALKSTTFDLVGEWIFSGELFDDPQDIDSYVREVLRASYDGYPKYRTEFADHVLSARHLVPAFLNYCLRMVEQYQPRLIGFTSVFQQHIASLALARRIKDHMPEVFIVFGGANCEGVMGIETVKQFAFVDAVVSGEGDIIFPQLVERVLSSRSVDDLQGVFTRANTELLVSGQRVTAPSVQDMDALPYPDYNDFFEQFNATKLDKPLAPRVLFETSRGCWWGEKNHCTFCGLNGSTMSFRSKSASRAMDELVYLANKYPGRPISVVDNIMDMKYFKDFIPDLISRDLHLHLFYEVKANLRKEQVRAMRDAGITQIQPGIESLSSHVLQLMRKGIKSLQNIQLLKWCKELGVWPMWNILWGFPGEESEDYIASTKLVPLISHLPPPKSVSVIRLDRFSPNFDFAEQYGFLNVKPYPAYDYIYHQLPQEARANLAYYFTFDYISPQDHTKLRERFRAEVQDWQEGFTTNDLFYVDKGECLLIWDFRRGADKLLRCLRGDQAHAYRLCDGIQSRQQLAAALASKNGASPSDLYLDAVLQPLVAHGLMLREGNSYLSLAIPLGDYTPKPQILQRLHDSLGTLGSTTGSGVVISLDEALRV